MPFALSDALSNTCVFLCRCMCVWRQCGGHVWPHGSSLKCKCFGACVCVSVSAYMCSYYVHITVYIIDEYDNDTSWHCTRGHLCARSDAGLCVLVYVCLCGIVSAKADEPPIASRTHHLGTDILTIDSTLFHWQRGKETDRQTDR